MMIDILLLAGGFAGLIYGANFLVEGASSLAKRLNVSDLVIGLTVVAFGTSAPELAVNVFAALDENSGMVLGNILGSNIFNVLGILGICAVIYPLMVKSNTTWIEIPLSLLSAVVLLLAGNDILIDKQNSSAITRIDGLLLLLFFIIFLGYIAQMMKSGNADICEKTKMISTPKASLLLVLGLGMLVGGGRAIVYSASNMAVMLGISDRIIGLTIVAIGTSLPEVATSLVAVMRKNVDIAIGNVVGSNIFNAFLILGISAVIHPANVNPANQLDFAMNIAASLLLFLFVLPAGNLRRWNGIVFLLLYAGYVFVLIYWK